MMQEDVGIYRDEAGLERALGRIEELQRRAGSARAAIRRPAFNPGWNLCRDLRNMLIVLGGDRARRAHAPGEPRRAQPARLPELRRDWGEHNIVVRKTADGMAVEPRPVVKARRSPRSSRRARRPSGMSARARCGSGAATPPAASFVDYEVEAESGHGRARRRARDPAHPGAGPGRALELQGREVRLLQRRDQRPPRLMCKTRLDHLPGGADPRRAAARVPRSSATW